jgi:hypothetical protein
MLVSPSRDECLPHSLKADPLASVLERGDRICVRSTGRGGTPVLLDLEVSVHVAFVRDAIKLIGPRVSVETHPRRCLGGHI